MKREAIVVCVSAALLAALTPGCGRGTKKDSPPVTGARPPSGAAAQGSTPNPTSTPTPSPTPAPAPAPAPPTPPATSSRGGMPVPTLTAIAGALSTAEAGSVVMPFDATISNPYKQPMNLLSTAYAVTSGGVVLAQGREDLRVKNVPPALAPGKSTSLPITARVTGAQALRALGGNRGGEDAPYVASVYVMIDSPVTGPITVTHSSSGTFTIPPTADAEVQGVLLDAAGGPGEGWIGLGVTNRNAWPITLSGMSIAGTLDGRLNVTGQASASARIEPGGKAEVNVPLTFNPLLSMQARPRPGSSIRVQLTGTVTADSPRGLLTMPITAEGEATVAR